MMAVGEMPAVSQVKSKNGISRLQHRRERFHVRLGTGVGLYIGVFGPKKLFGPLPRQVFDPIGELTTAVVPLTRIAFGIFVREYRAHGLEHGFADKVFGSDQ